MRIELTAYQMEWPEKFELLKSRFLPLISHITTRIEHVGSTSVEGLWAKPIIDLDIVVDTMEETWAVIEALKPLGYVFREDLHIDGREAIRHPKPDFLHNPYVCLAKSAAFLNHIHLRDHLRTHAEDLRLYSDLKRRLAGEGLGIEEYTEGKTEFILDILSRYAFGSEDLNSIREINRTKGICRTLSEKK